MPVCLEQHSKASLQRGVDKGGGEERRGRRIARWNELAISKNRRRRRKLQRRLRGEILSFRASQCGSVAVRGVVNSVAGDWERRG